MLWESHVKATNSTSAPRPAPGEEWVIKNKPKNFRKPLQEGAGPTVAGEGEVGGGGPPEAPAGGGRADGRWEGGGQGTWSSWRASQGQQVSKPRVGQSPAGKGGGRGAEREVGKGAGT